MHSSVFLSFLLQDEIVLVCTASGIVSSWTERIFYLFLFPFSLFLIQFMVQIVLVWFRGFFFYVVDKQKSLKKNLRLLFPQPYIHSFVRQYGNAFTAYSAVPCIERSSTQSHAVIKMCICFWFFLMPSLFKQLCHWSEMNTASEMTYISFIFEC